jgi:hypothetical protein
MTLRTVFVLVLWLSFGAFRTSAECMAPFLPYTTICSGTIRLHLLKISDPNASRGKYFLQVFLGKAAGDPASGLETVWREPISSMKVA